MENNNLEICIQLQIQGNSDTPTVLRRAIEQFLIETVVPLIQELTVGKEKIRINMEVIEGKLDKKK